MHKTKGFWTLKQCQLEAQKFKTKSNWTKNSSASYHASIKNGWLSLITKHMIKQRNVKGYWTKERCLEEAKKYKTRREWRNSTAYNTAIKNGWLVECCQHMKERKKPNGYWTKEQCIIDAKKYKTRSEWYLNSQFAYRTAIKNGWFNECVKWMLRTFSK